MITVNIKRETTLPTGETKKIRETYLSSKETCYDATAHILENVPGAEVVSTKKAKYIDVLGEGPFFLAKVNMIDGEKEKAKNVAILVSGEDYRDAVKNLCDYIKEFDARVISLSETKITEYVR